MTPEELKKEMKRQALLELGRRRNDWQYPTGPEQHLEPENWRKRASANANNDARFNKIEKSEDLMDGLRQQEQPDVMNMFHGKPTLEKIELLQRMFKAPPNRPDFMERLLEEQLQNKKWDGE